MDTKVEVRGIRELRSALKKVDADTPRKLREGFKRIATSVVDKAKPKVPRIKGDAQASLKARATTTGASIAFGGTKAPHFPWLDFGGRIPNAYRDFIPKGRYVYPTIESMNPEIKRDIDNLIKEVIEDAGFETN